MRTLFNGATCKDTGWFQTVDCAACASVHNVGVEDLAIDCDSAARRSNLPGGRGNICPWAYARCPVCGVSLMFQVPPGIYALVRQRAEVGGLTGGDVVLVFADLYGLGTAMYLRIPGELWVRHGPEEFSSLVQALADITMPEEKNPVTCRVAHEDQYGAEPYGRWVLDRIREIFMKGALTEFMTAELQGQFAQLLSAVVASTPSRDDLDIEARADIAKVRPA